MRKLVRCAGIAAAVVGHAILERLWPARHVREDMTRGFVGSFDVEQEALEAGELIVQREGDCTLLIPNPDRAACTTGWSPFDPETGELRDNLWTTEGFYPIGTISEDGIK